MGNAYCLTFEIRFIQWCWIWGWIPIQWCLTHVRLPIKVKYNVRPEATEAGGKTFNSKETVQQCGALPRV